MEIKNYLSKERIHYTVTLKEGKGKSIQLWEHIDGMNRHYKNQIGSVFTWRAEIIRLFLDKLVTKYQQDVKITVLKRQMILDTDGSGIIHLDKSQWNSDYRLPEEMAMKMLFAIKLVSSMEQRPRIEEALEIINSLTDEEISFWAWKVLSLKNAALNAFKAMYL
ncbi:DUF7680 family protein [Methanosarcina mazei]|uniref:DUF7680 family protein n=1 Tax=Methanosarcina mazei TaxID=2209 RepID=UPI00064E7C67|nr:hypothetical protein [Methanosarcina mazei]BBL64753.1 hypothetical protein MmazTMA_17300 [Methanosarcina mazei]